MSTKAYLYDSTSTDREVIVTDKLISELHDKQLLWIDIVEFTETEIHAVGRLLQLTRSSIHSLLQKEHRPRLINYGEYSQLNINTVQETDGRFRIAEVDFIFATNVVLTVHREPVEFLQSFKRGIKSDTDFGDLDARTFLAGLLDWHITGYFRLVEDLEIAIDKIDAHALQIYHTRDLLSEMARLRQHVALIRRILTPHREVYAGLVRTDTMLSSNGEVADTFSFLNSRLERAIESVENARELLIGSFDIFTTQLTLRTNMVMKVLTLVSFVWFPASVIVSISTMLMRTPVEPRSSAGFWIMIAIIGVIGLLTVLFARLKKWI